MSSICHVTFHVGDRSVEAVESAVREAVTELAARDDAVDDDPTIRLQHGNVVWSRSRHIEKLRTVAVPKAVETTYNDTAPGGDGELFLRLGEQLAGVDFAGSPGHGDGYLVDYFRINYGVVPRVGYDLADAPGTVARDDADEEWATILAVGDAEDLPVEPDRVGRWAAGWDDADVEKPDRETVVDLLSVDAYYPAARWMLAKLEATPPDAVLDRLSAEDPDVRARAVRRVAAAGSVRHWRDTDLTTDEYRRFLDALGTVDERTRALVAPALWEPTPLDGEGPPDPSLVASLAALREDEVPELRVAGLMGASAVLGHLHKAVERGKCEVSVFDGAVEPFYDAYEAALGDGDVRVRERAVEMARELFQLSGYLLSLWDRLPFERRWAIATAFVAVVADDATAARDGPLVLQQAFDGEPAAVPTLVEYGWSSRPQAETVRETLADYAEDDPESAEPALDNAAAAVAAGDETPADVELLAALAPSFPERVAAVAGGLGAMLDREGGDDDRRRRAAARALTHLPEDAVPVEAAALVEATGDVFDSYRLVPDRVAALAEVDPDEAVELLEELPAELGPDGRDEVERDSLERAVREVSETDPDVAAAALPALDPLFDDLGAVGRPLAVAMAVVAAGRPAAVAERVDAMAQWLGHPKALVREATATALVAVGTQDPDALPESVAPLVERADDAIPAAALADARNEPPRETPPEWPLGVVGAAAPAAAADAVAAVVPEPYGDLVDLVAEVGAGDREAGRRVIAVLFDSGELPVRNRTPLKRLAAERPAVVAAAADRVVAELADRDEATDEQPRRGFHPDKSARPLEKALATLAETRPAAVRSAVETQYESVAAFAERVPTDERRTLRERLDGEE